MSEKHSMSTTQSFNLGGSPALSRLSRKSVLWYLVPASVGALIGHLYGSQITSALLQRHARPSSCGLAPSPSDPEFVWETIVPSKNLSWVPCYDDKLCAKFAVPLDYSDPSGPEAAVAMIKVPAKISIGEAGYRGPVLFNPGGPGGSGVDMVRGRGAMLQKIIGGDFDLIGFDPRGVGRTEPKILLFVDKFESAAWKLLEAPPMNSTPDALARRQAQAIVYGSLAEKRVPDAAQYVSTATVSRDMLAITQAHGYEKLQYWGFSYGTVLGATFAAMFPDNVGRLIIDGVADAEDYYKTLWSLNLRDTDKTLKWFTDACADAGPDDCALYESSPAKVAARVDNLFAKLKTQPIAVPLPHNSTGAPSYGVVDYALVRGLVFGFLYKPMNNGTTSAASLARILAAADKGDGLLAWNANKDAQPQLKCECPGAPALPAMGSATHAIACSDGDPVDDSVEQLQELYEKMAKDSSFADMWGLRVSCSGWKIRPKERFNGPFVGNTSFPLLIIGNTADPVTPLWNAHKASKGFKDSVVLTQNSPGHCSLSAASLCTMKHVRNYFREGKVPKPNITCETEDKLFGGAAKAQDELEGADREFLDAVRELSAAFEVPRLPM